MIPAAIWELLSATGNFSPRLDMKVGELSHGEQRIVECLWTLYRPAEYILLDEPFSALSPIYIEFLQGVIQEQARAKGIILTDHVYRPLLQVADRIVLLHNNAVYKISEPADLIQYNYLPE